MKNEIAFVKERTNIFFHILTKCNLSCQHCYINHVEHGNLIMDYKTIIKWLKIFYKKNRNPNVIFLGGEPTMHPKLSLLVKKAKEIGYNSVSIDTNGYRIADFMNKINKKEVDFFNFSLDGPNSHINDILRGSGSFEICLKGINEVKKRGFKTSLIFTVSTVNFCYLNEMPELLQMLGIDLFFIQVIGLRGKLTKLKKKNNVLKQVDDIAWMKMIPNVAKRIQNKGITVVYPRVFLEPKDVFRCSGLFANNYFVFPNGRVYICPLCEDYPLHGKEIKKDFLITNECFNESNLFKLDIPEGCVLNKIVQADNIKYMPNGRIKYKIDCCMLKEELTV